jgi:hypothetical protein
MASRQAGGTSQHSRIMDVDLEAGPELAGSAYQHPYIALEQSQHAAEYSSIHSDLDRPGSVRSVADSYVLVLCQISHPQRYISRQVLPGAEPPVLRSEDHHASQRCPHQDVSSA